MQNARQDEAQAGTKTAGRNINNLRYAGDTTLMTESEEKLKKEKKEGENIQPSCTPFLIWNQSVVPSCPVLTVAS